MLGLPLQFRLRADIPGGKGVHVLQYHPQDGRFFSKLWNIDGIQLHQIRPRRLKDQNSKTSFAGEDFVPLCSTKSQTFDSDTLIRDKISSETPSVDNERCESHSKLPAGQAQFGQVLSKLETTVRTFPTDILAWLALADAQKGIEGQTSMIQTTWTADKFKESFTSRKKACNALAQVQIAVLEKAQRAHPANKDSAALALARLRLAGQHGLLSRTELMDEWYRVLRYAEKSNDEARSIETWTQFAEWRISEGGYATHEILNVFATAFEQLRAKIDGPSTVSATKALLKLQLTLYAVLHGAGYPALASAVAQAQFELVFGLPPGVETLPWSEQLSRLREFWESECPRLGEPAAHGWSQSDGVQQSRTWNACAASQRSDDGLRRSNGFSDLSLDDSIDEAIQQQRRLSQRRHLPSRVSDVPDLAAGEGEVDPYSIVFFRDVEAFLIPSVTPEQILPMVFRFLGLPSNLFSVSSKQPQVVNLVESFWPEHLRHRQQVQRAAGGLRFDIVNGEPMEKERVSSLTNPSQCPVGSGFVGSFCDLLWPSYKGIELQWQADSATQVNIEFLGTLATLRPSVGLHHLRTKLIEISQGPQAAAETVKGLLASQEDDWLLWRAFAFLQRLAGKLKSARKVYRSCLASAELRNHSAAIWLQWIELELEFSRPEMALRVLAEASRHAFSGGIEVGVHCNLDQHTSVGEILRAKQNIQGLIESQCNPSVEITISAGWLAYLSASPDERLSSAIAATKKSVAHYNNSAASAIEARVHQVYASLFRILRHHLDGVSPIYRPVEVRQVLLEALDRYPHDTSFLMLLAAHESRFKIEGVVRRTIAECVLPSSQNVALEQSCYDLSRQYRTVALSEHRQSTAEVNQPLDKNVTGGEAGRIQCPSIHVWLAAIYVELQINAHRVNANQVRSMFEHAIQRCNDSSGIERPGDLCTLWTAYLSFELRFVLLVQSQQPYCSFSDEGKFLSAAVHANKGNRRLRSQYRRRCRMLGKLLSERAKGVFYRAIAQVPWHREIHLWAFESPFRFAFSLRELLQIASVMSNERDLRIYGDVGQLLNEEDPLDTDPDASLDRYA